ncbi:hypothetical protein A2856_02075 [Candidatus Uhrbacteria bacterium RIFCSPHIGHO2_01_FULL_63_20]|uniref:AtpZ/AtpI family protein n=1 Tax=Candidatus Uhrbacteria bacterium RIFCSPHIGHO2_01_FULL_63_20 TaxID=1802385 RepID=A0A1F7TLN5_9BACT|nr:MAG: hypothetical protein A2856_02075 [Candidatus Uhrbacteria bacterium RIFCSPHIGHO2_01_FULL_63_20]
MNDQAYVRLAWRIFADFGVGIAAPAVFGALAGKWLDAKYGTTPTFLIVCLALAFLLTSVWAVKKAKLYAAEYQALIDKEKHPTPPSKL